MSELSSWLTSALGTKPRDPALYDLALTHGSHGKDSYQRLEFLGDRVLGLVIARWLFDRFPEDAEGQLSRRLNALVSGEVCAEIARDIGVSAHLRLGKQARDDGAYDSPNVLGDVVEALIGALLLDHGLEAAESLIKTRWAERVDILTSAPSHPKSALQEWAAANNRKPPLYETIDRSGPHHAPRFTVRASVGTAGDATGNGGSKQEAETAAATALLQKLAQGKSGPSTSSGNGD